MKILIPILNFSRHGGYRVLSNLANELISLNHEVVFLCPSGSDEPYFPTSAKIYWVNNDENITEVHNKKSVENAFSIQNKLTKGLKKIGGEFDAIMANQSLTIMPLKKAGLLSKTLYYVQAYEPEYYEQIGGIKKNILKYFSERSYRQDVFTVVNADIYKNYKSLHSERVLYPGIDFDLFYPDKSKSINKKKIIIGTIGRNDPYKGTRFVIEAFKILQAKFNNIELHVAFGEDNSIPTHGITNLQPHGDKALSDYYRSLDFYFCTGYSQLGAFHYPVGEAMASGVALITTNYYPANDNNAWLIKELDTEDLVAKFETAFLNDEERSRRIKKALIDVKQFEWKIVAKRLEQYFFELLEKKIN